MLNLENKLSKEKIANNTFILSRYLDDYFGLIILIVVLLLIIASYFLFWFPRYMDAVDRVAKARTTVSEELNSLVRYKGQLLSYKEAYMSISDLDKDRINDIIGPANKYDSIYVSDLLINYRDLFGSNGYVLSSIDVQWSDVKVAPSSKRVNGQVEEGDTLPEGVGIMTVDISLKEMDYDKLRDLLKLLESELRVVDIRSLNCGANVTDCNIKFDTYFFLAAESDKASAK